MIDRFIAYLPMLLLLVLAAKTDLRTRRIPNKVTLALVTLGLVRAAISTMITPASGNLMFALQGIAAGAVLTLIFYAVGALGAGDVKLMAGLGAWLGPTGLLVVFSGAAVVGMAIAIGQCVARGKTVALARSSTVALCNLMYVAPNKLRSLRDAAQDCPSVGPPLPYAVPVLIATLLLVGLFQAW
jgi:prepilin peptidase CpaA